MRAELTTTLIVEVASTSVSLVSLLTPFVRDRKRRKAQQEPASLSVLLAALPGAVLSAANGVNAEIEALRGKAADENVSLTDSFEEFRHTGLHPRFRSAFERSVHGICAKVDTLLDDAAAVAACSGRTGLSIADVARAKEAVDVARRGQRSMHETLGDLQKEVDRIRATV